MTQFLDRVPQSVFRILSIIVIGVLLLMIVFPIYFMATTAFKMEREIYSELTWIPREPTMDNFNAVIYSFRIPVYLRNTLIVASITTSIVVVV